LKYFDFPVREAQTDNGSEFTNALLVVKTKHKTLFEQTLADMGISYRRIRHRHAAPQRESRTSAP